MTTSKCAFSRALGARRPCAGRTAEDIDIFATRCRIANDLPNVLIIWDNPPTGAPASRWPTAATTTAAAVRNRSPDKEQGTKFAIEKCAIYNVIDALPVNPDGAALFNIGFMLFNANGGYPRKQFVPLTAANKALLKDIIRNITIGGDKGTTGPSASRCTRRI